MLASVREFAGERLRERGAERILRRVHAERYAALVEASEPATPAGNREAAWPLLEEEHDNLRAALAFSREAGDIELELRLVAATAYFWAVREHLREGRRNVESVLERSPAGTSAVR